MMGNITENMTIEEAICEFLEKWLATKRLPMPTDAEFKRYRPSPSFAPRSYRGTLTIGDKEIECDVKETEPRVKLIGRIAGEQIVMEFTMIVIQCGDFYRINLVKDCGFEVPPSEKAYFPSKVVW